jgi:protoheme IX farnesyltransferase
MTHATGLLPGPVPVPAPGHTRRPARLVARSLVALTKPRIIELLLVTTLPTMMPGALWPRAAPTR